MNGPIFFGYDGGMKDSKKPRWLLDILDSAAEGEMSEGYIRAWVAEQQAKLDAQRGVSQPLTEEDNAEIGRMLERSRRGPMV